MGQKDDENIPAPKGYIPKWKETSSSFWQKIKKPATFLSCFLTVVTAGLFSWDTK